MCHARHVRGGYDVIQLQQRVVGGGGFGVEHVETGTCELARRKCLPQGGFIDDAAYCEENPPPRTPGDLTRHRCIRVRLPSGGIYRWEFAQRSETLNIDVPGVLTLDEPTLLREAALAGAGLACMWEARIAQDLAAGRLVSVLNEWMPSEPGLCLYYPGRRNVPASLRAFIDVIREIDPPADDAITGPARGDSVGPE